MHEGRQLPSGNAGTPERSSLRSNLSYYDVALAVVPVPLLVGFLAEELLALTPGLGVSVGATASALVVGYLLFGNPPMRPSSSSPDSPTSPDSSTHCNSSTRPDSSTGHSSPAQHISPAQRGSPAQRDSRGRTGGPSA